MKKVSPLLALILVFAACQKENNDSNLAPVATSFNELSVPANFNWTSGTKIMINARINANPQLPLNLEGSFLYVINEAGERVALSKINANHQAKFNLSLPSEAKNYKFMLPATGEEWPLELKNEVNLNLADPLDNPNFSQKKLYGKAAISVSPPGTNILGNADFENNIIYSNVGYPYDPTTGTVDDGKWYVTDNEWSQTSQNGSTVFKVDNNRWTHLWQFHTVNAGDSIHFTADWGGTTRAFLFFYADENSKNPVSLQTIDFSNGNDVISTIVPANATVVTALFNLYDNAWIDNTFLSNPPAITDSDNDGVADNEDDFPNDPTRAYLSYYPSAGRQTIAFEDMWPVQGDYDFNDMVVSLDAELTKDGDGNWVTAEYTIALDAFGGGIESGLALRLTDGNKAAMSNIIASVSGDASLDPNVDNGIIIFSDPDDVRSEYYNNTEAGLINTPDTLRFTINFGTNNGADFNPDFYIFHRLERGREIHLVGYTGTAAADASLYNTGDDVNGTYKTAAGLPWAMDLILDGENFKHPYEKVDMISAYPQFSTWASSGGISNLDWFENPSLSDIVDLLL